MTEITFYILQSNTNSDLIAFACKLIEKAARQGGRILVHTGDEVLGEQLNQTLWDFRPDAYVPHRYYSEEYSDLRSKDIAEKHKTVENDSHPVEITANTDIETHGDILVNLSLERPSHFARFHRFIQCVNQDVDRLNEARRNYTFFRDRGYPIENIRVKY